MHRFLLPLVAALIATASFASSVIADDRPKQPNVVLVLDRRPRLAGCEVL